MISFISLVPYLACLSCRKAIARAKARFLFKGIAAPAFLSTVLCPLKSHWLGNQATVEQRVFVYQGCASSLTLSAHAFFSFVLPTEALPVQ
jgi:hypothetical protein